MKRFKWLSNIISRNGYKDIVQVGTGRGATTRHLLKHNPEIKLYEIAYYPDDGTGQDSSDQDKRKWLRSISSHKERVVKLEGKSEHMSQLVREKSVDLVFIDANHSYMNCLQDIRLWLPKVRVGGIISGHDYHHPRFPGVEKAVDEIFDEVNTEDDHVWWAYV